MSSWDVLRVLIRKFKESDLDEESFSDAIDEFTSDDTVKIRMAIGLLKYIENLEFYNFADVKKLSDFQRERLGNSVLHYIQDYLRTHKYSPEWSDELDNSDDSYRDVD